MQAPSDQALQFLGIPFDVLLTSLVASKSSMSICVSQFCLLNKCVSQFCSLLASSESGEHAQAPAQGYRARLVEGCRTRQRFVGFGSFFPRLGGFWAAC